MGKLVLVVEDDPKNMKLTRDLLEISGFSSMAAVNGEQGVAATKEHKPDLVLMDIMMPKMDGYTACHAIKTDPATKNIPVIMLTALGFALNKQLAQKFGASGYLTKPVSRQGLLAAISPFMGAP